MIKQLVAHTLADHGAEKYEHELAHSMLYVLANERHTTPRLLLAITPGELYWEYRVLESREESGHVLLEEHMEDLLHIARDKCVWQVRISDIHISLSTLPPFATVVTTTLNATVLELSHTLLPRQVVYEDECMIAINKPSGLIVHRSDIASRVPVAALQLVRDYCDAKVWPVHRLDRPTSGVLLFAKSRDVANELTNKFARKEVSKHYVAVVRGWTEPQGEIDSPIRPKGEKEDKHKKELPARTVYTTLDQQEFPFEMPPFEKTRLSMVRVLPETGRQHQIRRHMRRLNNHILGDTRFGDGRYNALLKREFGVFRLMLHAESLKINHPVTDCTTLIEAPLPPEFAAIFPKSSHPGQELTREVPR